MEIAHLIEALSRTAAYPFPVQEVAVRHTHVSVVFLAGPFAYKVKKPVDLGFLDFTTLPRRRHFCAEEVRLNRRLAPAVYLGVVPVTRTASGLHLEGPGEAIEWAVKMERLPDEATLLRRVERGAVGPGEMTALAGAIAAFHARAQSGPAISAFARFDAVARNARENFEQSAPAVGITVCPAAFDRLRQLTEEALVRLRPLIEARAARGVPRDTHGDLRLEHVYLLPQRLPPDDLAIIDCIEFNERFRFADPVADLAFLVMDLLFHGRQDLAAELAREHFRASCDPEGANLLPFYTAYRACVRAKVSGLELLEKEVPPQEREAALARARAHWLLALDVLQGGCADPALPACRPVPLPHAGHLAAPGPC
jgi:aminoglycoside phosphotransferase family enzyme